MRSRRLGCSNSLWLLLCTTQEQAGLLGNLSGLEQMFLPHIPVEVELLLFIDVPSQPYPLFLSGMSVLEI